MSFQAVAWAIEQRVGDALLKNLLMTICHHADREQWNCWPSQELLSHESEVSKRTIQRKLKDLEKLGFIRIEARRVDGKQANSMIWVTGGQPVTLSPSGGQGRPVLVDNKESTSNKQSIDNTQSNRPAKQQDGTYPEEFEALWKIYPRTKNTSKKKAHDIWRMLNAENQARVAAAIPIFAAAMRAEGRAEDKIKHFQFFLSERIYETVSAPAGTAAGVSTKDWYKTLTREQWQKILNVWAMTNSWGISHGPEPGKPGCLVPPDMVAAHNVKHRGYMFSPEQLEEFREKSKQPVDTPTAA